MGAHGVRDAGARFKSDDFDYRDVVQFGRTLASGARGCTFKSCHSDLWGCSSFGRAPALQAGGRGFESLQFHSFHFCRISSMVEQLFRNQQVMGSNPMFGLCWCGVIGSAVDL